MITLTSCISVDYDLALLPHFVKHYSKLKIDKYKFIFHSKYKFYPSKFEHLLEPLKSKVEISTWVGEFNASDKVDRLNALQTEGLILTADVDELQIWDRPLDKYFRIFYYIKSFFSKKKRVVWGFLRDRESKDSNLPFVSSVNLEEQFPIISNKSKWGRSAYKPCLFPYNVRLSSPHHLEGYEPKGPFIDVDHYRWISGRLEKSIERVNTYRKLNKQGKKLEEFGFFPTQGLQNVIDEYGTKTPI